MPLNSYWASGGEDRHFLTVSLFREANPADVVRLVRYGNRATPGDGLDANLETGPEVHFDRSGIAFTPPDIGELDKNQKFRLVLDNVSLEASKKLLAWRKLGGRVIVEYRAYLASDLSGPKEGPIAVTLESIEITNTRVTGQCSGIEVLRRPFPNLIWTPSISPGLVRT